MRTLSRRNLILLLKYKSSNWNALMTAFCSFAANNNVYITVTVSLQIVSVVHFARFARSTHLLPARETTNASCSREFRHYIAVLCHSSWISIWRSELRSRSCHNWRRWGCRSLFILQISRAHCAFICVANFVTNSRIRVENAKGNRLLSSFIFIFV